MVELEEVNADECVVELLQEDPTHNDDVDEASEQEDFEEVHTGIQTACMLRDLALLTSDLPPVHKNRVLPGNAGLPAQDSKQFSGNVRGFKAEGSQRSLYTRSPRAAHRAQRGPRAAQRSPDEPKSSPAAPRCARADWECRGAH